MMIRCHSKYFFQGDLADPKDSNSSIAGAKMDVDSFLKVRLHMRVVLTVFVCVS